MRLKVCRTNVSQALKRKKEAGLEAQGSAQQLQQEREGLQERLRALQVVVTTLQTERGALERSMARLGRDKTSLRKALEKVGPSVRPYRFSSPRQVRAGTHGHSASACVHGNTLHEHIKPRGLHL